MGRTSRLPDVDDAKFNDKPAAKLIPKSTLVFYRTMLSTLSI